MSFSNYSRIKNSWWLLAGLIVFLLFSATGIPGVNAAGFTVNSTVDRADASPGDGVCRTTTAGECTLRAALQEANSSPGPDTITLPAGVYALQIPTLNEDLDGTGDFDIHCSL